MITVQSHPYLPFPKQSWDLESGEKTITENLSTVSPSIDDVVSKISSLAGKLVGKFSFLPSFIHAIDKTGAQI